MCQPVIAEQRRKSCDKRKNVCQIARLQTFVKLQPCLGVVTCGACRPLRHRRSELGRRRPGRACRARPPQAPGRDRHHEPATFNQVAAAVGRGAPAVSRSVETLVRAGPGRARADRPTAAGLRFASPIRAGTSSPTTRAPARASRSGSSVWRTASCARSSARSKSSNARISVYFVAPAAGFPALLGGGAAAACCGPNRRSCRPCPAC